MAIGKICNRKLVVAYLDSTVTEAASLMREHHTGSVIVVDHRGEGARPIGIITDRDLVVEVLAQGVPLDSVTLRDVMTVDPIIAREDDGVWETIQMMGAKGVRRIPVVNAQGLLIGIVTVDDLRGPC